MVTDTKTRGRRLNALGVVQGLSSYLESLGPEEIFILSTHLYCKKNVKTTFSAGYPASRGIFDLPRIVGKRKSLFSTFLGRSKRTLLAALPLPDFSRKIEETSAHRVCTGMQ